MAIRYLNLVLLPSWVISQAIIPCNEFICSKEIVTNMQRSNDLCDLDCMHAACNFDSFDEADQILYKEQSGCLSECLRSNSRCTYEMLGNGACEKGNEQVECNAKVCGWDWGDCGYCARNCSKGLLENNLPICAHECNNMNCYFQKEVCVRSR
jgi:hypothetical protein